MRADPLRAESTRAAARFDAGHDNSLPAKTDLRERSGCSRLLKDRSSERSGSHKCARVDSEPPRGKLGGIVCLAMEQLDLTIVYEPGQDGWVIASIPEVAGVFSQGHTREEARANVIEALRLMLSPEPRDADDRREREPLHLTIAA